MADSILIAEDERASAEYLKLLLEERGFEVRVAGNGVEALLALEARPVDLVITDLRMPSMDGFELLSHLAQRWPNLPAIVLSGNDGVEDILEAVRLGAVNYLLKPATPAAVVSAVERALLTRERSVVADATVPELVGTSKAMVEVRHRVLMAARAATCTSWSRAIRARAESSSRARDPHAPRAWRRAFVAHNCALRRRPLRERVLRPSSRVVHRARDRDRRGAAAGGASGACSFLDELETLDPVFQAKLLRA
ncbi:MAG: response regulator [Myxococcota bacterium]